FQTEENKTIKVGDWHSLMWRACSRKFYPQLRWERAAMLTLTPPGPVRQRGQSPTVRPDGLYITQLNRGKHAGVGQRQLEDIVG
ncbi:hypothetical protein KUCAC02_028292, partial [Chaenocephalus aceratus]